jgi:hypothetical protein
MKTQHTNPRRFWAFKVSLCGNQLKRGYIPHLTIEEARAMPEGKQKDEQGFYVWSFALMETAA